MSGFQSARHRLATLELDHENVRTAGGHGWPPFCACRPRRSIGPGSRRSVLLAT